MRPQPTPTELAAWRSFLIVHARITECLAAELHDAHRIPLTWYDVLVHLSEAPEHRLRMHDLAQAVLLSRAGLTRLVDRMTRQGLVYREPCEDDRRGTFVVASDAGLRALREAAPLHLKGIHQHFTSHLTADEVRVFDTAFRRILTALPTPP